MQSHLYPRICWHCDNLSIANTSIALWMLYLLLILLPVTRDFDLIFQRIYILNYQAWCSNVGRQTLWYGLPSQNHSRTQGALVTSSSISNKSAYFFFLTPKSKSFYYSFLFLSIEQGVVETSYKEEDVPNGPMKQSFW